MKELREALEAPAAERWTIHRKRIFDAARKYLALQEALADGSVPDLPGAEVVSERTIEFRDDYGGYSYEVLDYEVDKRQVRRYLVVPLAVKEKP